MNVTLHPEMEKFVREIVASGVYQSPEDVIHHALLILKYSEEDWTLEELKKGNSNWFRSNRKRRSDKWQGGICNVT